MTNYCMLYVHPSYSDKNVSNTILIVLLFQMLLILLISYALFPKGILISILCLILSLHKFYNP